jgi:hypothetical protein
MVSSLPSAVCEPASGVERGSRAQRGVEDTAARAQAAGLDWAAAQGLTRDSGHNHLAAGGPPARLVESTGRAFRAR